MPSYKIYYFVHTGHRIGLDRFRRAMAILNQLKEYDITLLCSDFRIAHEARHFGIEKSVGIDVVRNIVNIAQNGDKIIFDSDEANPLMLEGMRTYFSSFIRISDDINDFKSSNEFLISPYLDGDGVCKAYAIDDKYFATFNKKTPISFFFGDDDYEKDLEKHLDFIDGLEVSLGLGYYYFLDYEDFLKEKFKNIYEFEDYDEMIQESEILISASPQAILENLASGGKPIYFQREDYLDIYQELFRELNIPIILDYDKSKLFTTIKNINSHEYAKIGQNGNKITEFIKETLIL